MTAPVFHILPNWPSAPEAEAIAGEDRTPFSPASASPVLWYSVLPLTLFLAAFVGVTWALITAGKPVIAIIPAVIGALALAGAGLESARVIGLLNVDEEEGR